MLVSVALRRCLNHLPDLEVLDGVSVGVLRGSLPSDQVGSQGGEPQLKDIFGRNRRDDVSNRRIDNSDPLGRSPGKISAAWRISATAEVPLRTAQQKFY
jgi:hypothetical protein